MKPKIFTSKPITLTPAIRQATFEHGLLHFGGVDHSGPSYVGRVYFNNPQATERTPTTPEEGYAGYFAIFGHGRCWGDEGHCMIQPPRPFDHRSPNKLTPQDITLNVTDALKKAARERARLTITVVPLLGTSLDPSTVRDCVQFESLSIRIRSSHGLLEDPFLASKASSG